MATIYFGGGTLFFDPNNLPVSTAPNNGRRGPEELVVGQYTNEFDEVATGFYGKGFTYDISSENFYSPTGGTVHAIDTIDTSKTVRYNFRAEKLEIDLAPFAPLFDTDLTARQKDVLFLDLVMAGNDRISVRYGQEVGGDGLQVSKGTTKRGGDDNIDVSESLNGAGDTLEAHGTLYGGNDIIQGGSGKTTLWGDARLADGKIYCGNDTLKGGKGDDRLFGDVELLETKKITYGADRLDGQDGNDRLDGNGGVDTLTGGKGRDTFIFSSSPNSDTNFDKITDFNAKDDTIELRDEAFAGLKTGTLEDFRFKVVKYGTQKDGVDKSDRILYDEDDGKLYFDRDGSGSKYKSVKFAEVADNTNLSHLDFLIV